MQRTSIYQKTRYQFHALLAVVALSIGGLGAAAYAVKNETTPKPLPPIPSVTDLKETATAFTAVARRAEPAVVFVQVKKNLANQLGSNQGNVPDFFNDDMLKRFFGDKFDELKPKFESPQTPRFSMGQGSGFIITEDGYILTNAHVVGGADEVTVKLSDGRQFDAEIVGVDERSDVAIVKVDETGLPHLPMGNSDAIQVGQWVLAVGSPFGLPGTVTSGIISAEGRSAVGIADYEDFIQTDAAINPGNSGGPLLNLEGQVIGINTAIASRTGVYNGIGFAIPINMARDIGNDLIENGKVTRGYLGIAIQQLTAELAKSFSLDADTKGVLVGDVTAGSPAEKSGLKSGDVIVEFAGQKVDKLGAFRNRVAITAPGSTLDMVVLRDGKRVPRQVTIGTLPGKNEIASAEATPKDTVTSLGLTVAAVTDAITEKLDLTDRKGVVVTNVQSGSAASAAGIRAGMLITEVDRKPVDSVDAFKAAIDAAAGKDSVLLRVHQDELSRFVVLKLDR